MRGKRPLLRPAVAGQPAVLSCGGSNVARQAFRSGHGCAIACVARGDRAPPRAGGRAHNDLVEAGLERALADEVHVVYVSPLKALSNDIEKNLQEPLSGIRAELLAIAGRDVPIRVAVRT